LHDIVLAPANLTRAENLDLLTLKAAVSTAGLEPGKTYTAQVQLKDGRRLTAPVTVQPPRPSIMLLSKGVQDAVNGNPQSVQFGSPDDFPVDGKLVFFLKSTTPASFPRDERIEVAAADSSFQTLLSLADGSLLLADSATAQASLQPMARFGFSAFGPIRVRAVAADGQTSDWLPLGTLVRMPVFKALQCPRAESQPCLLSGSNLFLATAIAANPQFDSATPVPPEFTGTQLIVPHPVNGTIYVKLRDDPNTVQSLMLPGTTLTAAEQKAALPLLQPAQPLPTPAAAADSSAPPDQTAPPDQPQEPQQPAASTQK